jgi:hypothetical protein
MNDDYVEQLGKQLGDIELSAREYDAGNKDAAVRIAKSLRVIFHHTGEAISLLAHLKARFIRLSTSVEKPPYPQDWYSPMAELEKKFSFPAIDAAARPQDRTVVEPPTYRPMLSRKKLTRQVQAPDWWGNEPVIIRNGKKVTRKVIVLASSGADGDTKSSKVDDAHLAALRQMAHEVLKSPELLKLARR